MKEPMKVTIAGKDFSLVGDNPEVIQSAVKEVDKQIKELKLKHKEEPMSTLSVLAALNIAERFYEARIEGKTDIDYIKNELNKMADFIKPNLQK